MIGMTDRPMNTVGASCAPQREPQIREAMNRLNAATEKAEKAAQSLASRIESVMTPPMPEPGCKSETASSEQVPLAAYLREMAYRVERVADGLASTERRVEL